MIAFVIIMLSVFSAALYHYLPADRDPTISVLMSNDRQNVTLWHKGGDWVKIEEVSVVIGNESHRMTFTRQKGALVLVPNKTVFDLGSNITVMTGKDLEGNETVKLLTSRTVIYSGRISL